MSTFGAHEVFRIESETGHVVVRLALGASQFWVADESPDHGNFSPESLGGGTVRMLLLVDDPDAVFARAVATGAKSISPVGNQHGWRAGRVADPYGRHWEIARQL